MRWMLRVRGHGSLVCRRVEPKLLRQNSYRVKVVDVDNDGTLDYRPGEPVRNNINQWILFRW